MIAIVFESFVRAGSQRHMVEILKGIRLFNPELNCCFFVIAPLAANWPTFLPEIKKANVPVVHLPYRYDRRDGSGLGPRFHNILSRRFRERVLNDNLYSQLAACDVVVCAQPFVADLLLPHLHRNQRLCFHLMEHLAQRATIGYGRLLRHPSVNLIYMHPSQVAQLAHLQSPNPSITWPVRLCPDHLQQPLECIPGTQGVLRVAHYSRISPMRLIDQVIDAFALLHRRLPARLRIAGFIEDAAYHQQLLDQIQRLGLAEAVQFVDPVPSPAEDPARQEVDLVWMISLSGHVGYAGLEAMASGMPTLLLEVDTHAHSTEVETQLQDLICTTPSQLVERSLALRSDPGAFLREQRQLMRDRFITTKEAIDELTAFYLGTT